MRLHKSIFLPDLYVKSLAYVDFTMLYKQGIRLALLDIDNTLSKHGSIVGGDYAKEQIERVRNAGIECMIISNARSKRAQTFADSIGIDLIPKARKPSRRGIRTAMQRHPELERTQITVIGDQILTDILAGNRAKVFTILLDPISDEESFQVRLKRPFERHLKWIFKIRKKDN